MIARASSTPEGSGVLTLDVVVRSRHLLVAQSVGAALRRREVSARVVPWESGGQPAGAPGDVVLLIDPLDTRAALDAVRAAVARSTVPVLVLTSRPMGAAWGGVLEAGAAGLLSNGASLEELEDALDCLRDGAPLGPELHGAGFDRAGLVDSWRQWEVERDELERRLGTLSARETTVLVRLSEGHRVVDIAEMLGVSESTVRSQVKSLRRKLGVDSQLAAVAVVRRLTGGPAAERPPVPRPRAGGRG